MEFERFYERFIFLKFCNAWVWRKNAQNSLGCKSKCDCTTQIQSTMTHERHKVETETETETETVERFYQAFLNTSSVSGPTPPIETPRIFAYIRIRIRIRAS